MYTAGLQHNHIRVFCETMATTIQILYLILSLYSSSASAKADLNEGWCVKIQNMMQPDHFTLPR